MKHLSTIVALVAMLLASAVGFAQERYLDEVFAEVKVTDSVVYGNNISILPIILAGSPTPLPVDLYMDVYEPMGDTVSNRPVIIYAITGTFFPALVNRGFTGERSDPGVVSFATRMAKRGYVVGVVQYRRGWNPAGAELEAQRTILQAAYRGIQDVRNAVRYFRFSEAEDGNPFGIDPDRIAVGGTGTGAYMSYGAGYLDNQAQAQIQKFIDFEADPPTPFVDTLVYGNPTGTSTAPLCLPNYPTYSSEFNVGFGLDGALGDSSWIEPGDPPFIAMHSATNPGAPPFVGDVIAINASTGLPFAVIPEAAGGFKVIEISNRLGNQTVFDGVDFSDDPLSVRAEAINGGLGPAMYPFITPFTPGDAMCRGVGVAGDTLLPWNQPWSYFDPAVAEATWNFVFQQQIMEGAEIPGATAVCLATTGVPNDPNIAEAYLDTIARFLSPRLAVAMNLRTTGGIDNFIKDKNLKVYPNPSANTLFVDYRGLTNMIQEVRLLDMAGRVVRNYDNLKVNALEIDKGSLPKGLYMLQVKVDRGVVNRKVMFTD